MSVDDSLRPLAKYILSKWTKNKLQAICQRNNLKKFGTKSSIIEMLCDSVLKNELFSKEPINMLDWYERLFLASIIKGPQKKAGITQNNIFKAFLEKIGGEQKDQERLRQDIFRWSRKKLIRGGLVTLDPQRRVYSINPEARSALSPLKRLDIDQLVDDFNRCEMTKYYYRKKTFPRIIIEIPTSIDELRGIYITPKVEFVKFSKKKPKMVSPNQVADKTRILAFSDWRVQRISDIFLFVKKIEPVDFIVYAGDDIRRFKGFDANYFSELSKSTLRKEVLAVMGNDDVYSTSKNTLQAKDVHNLYDQSFVYKNYAFIGLESSTSGPAIFKHEESDFKTHLNHQTKRVKGKRLIVVSHAPPFGILDRGIRFATEDEETHHIGSTALKNFIEKNSVDLVICGHCHSHGGMVDKFKDTTIVNVSSHDSSGSKGNLAIIELSSDGLVSIDWHDTNEVLDMDSPMRIHGIGPFYCETLDKCGINTIGHLAEVENISALSHSSGISERLLMKFQLKAKSMINDAIYQISPFILPMDNLIFFDIETDTACDRVWLIGILIDGRFIQLYADNWEQERTYLRNS